MLDSRAGNGVQDTGATSLTRPKLNRLIPVTNSSSNGKDFLAAVDFLTWLMQAQSIDQSQTDESDSDVDVVEKLYSFGPIIDGLEQSVLSSEEPWKERILSSLRRARSWRYSSLSATLLEFRPCFLSFIPLIRGFMAASEAAVKPTPPSAIET